MTTQIIKVVNVREEVAETSSASTADQAVVAVASIPR
jgi:hypothetical protein